MKRDNTPSPLPLPLANTLSYVARAAAEAEIRPLCSVMTSMEECHGGLERFLRVEGFPKT